MFREYDRSSKLLFVLFPQPFLPRRAVPADFRCLTIAGKFFATTIDYLAVGQAILEDAGQYLTVFFAVVGEAFSWVTIMLTDIESEL